MDSCKSPEVPARGDENLVFIKHFFVVKASLFPKMNQAHPWKTTAIYLQVGRPDAQRPHPPEEPLRPQASCLCACALTPCFPTAGPQRLLSCRDSSPERKVESTGTQEPTLAWNCSRAWAYLCTVSGRAHQGFPNTTRRPTSHWSPLSVTVFTLAKKWVV